MKTPFTCFIISITAILLSCNNTETINPNLEEQDSTIYTIVNQVPIPPGGDMDEYLKSLEEKINYTSEALENEIEGVIYTNVVIDAEGNLIWPEVVKGLGYGLDEEALRVIKASEKWTPGKHNDKPLFAQLILALNFNIN